MPLSEEQNIVQDFMVSTNELIAYVHEYSVKAGWQEEIETLRAARENASPAHPWNTSQALMDGAIRSHQAEQIMLMVTELAEAMEELRHGRAVTETYYSGGHRLEDSMGNLNGPLVEAKPEGIPSELADVFIRILDFAGTYGVDIASAIIEKINYNETRGYKHGGKTV